MDNNLKRTIIVENYSNPFNKGLIDDKDYMKINTRNESCIDNIDLVMKINNNIIEDLRFDGEACAISTSATSIMIKLLLGKNIEEAKKIIDEYKKMINEESFDVDTLGEAVVYDEIYKQPNRKKCALLPIRGIEGLIDEYLKNN